jgi:hypothetical protein
MTIEIEYENQGATDHLEEALVTEDGELKNYHIRQAMQLMLTDSA